MPNWCENDLTVSGPADDVKRFKEFAKGTVLGDKQILCADKFIPYPKSYLDADRKAQKQEKLREKYEAKLLAQELSPQDARQKAYQKYPHVDSGFNKGGYRWCVDNWGTKWGFCHTELVEDSKFENERTLIYRTDTAWSPPLPIVIKMGEKFPKLIFDLRYFEAGMCFNGLLRIEKGEVVKDVSGDYFGDRGG